MYRAYNPGDPFRIVVPEPNTIAEPLIYADYAGLKLARQELIAFTGIDTPNNLRPIDVFIFVVLTVALIAFGELFASSRLYEYIGSLAPKGQEGLFLGYANLPMAIGSPVPPLKK